MARAISPELGLGFLADASGALGPSLDWELSLGVVASLAVPRLADWCAVDVIQSDGSLQQITSRQS